MIETISSGIRNSCIKNVAVGGVTGGKYSGRDFGSVSGASGTGMKVSNQSQ